MQQGHRDLGSVTFLSCGVHLSLLANDNSAHAACTGATSPLVLQLMTLQNACRSFATGWRAQPRPPQPRTITTAASGTTASSPRGSRASRSSARKPAWQKRCPSTPWRAWSSWTPRWRPGAFGWMSALPPHACKQEVCYFCKIAAEEPLEWPWLTSAMEGGRKRGLGRRGGVDIGCKVASQYWELFPLSLPGRGLQEFHRLLPLL